MGQDGVEIDPFDTEGTYGQFATGQGGTRTIPGTAKLIMVLLCACVPAHLYFQPSEYRRVLTVLGTLGATELSVFRAVVVA